MLENEVFVPVKDFEEKYMISNYGRVYSFKKQIIRKFSLNRFGYLFLGLSIRKGVTKNAYAHRLVAEHFIPNPENLPQVNHIDGDKQNNHVDNLEWVTPSQNTKHAYDIGLKNADYMKEIGRERFVKYNKSRRKAVLQLHIESNEILKEWESALRAGETLNIDSGDIAKCCKGKKKTVGGYKWKYRDFEFKPYVPKKVGKTVYRINESNEIEEEYNTLKEAADKLGVNIQHIHYCINKKKTYNDSKLVYGDEYDIGKGE